MGNNKSTVTGTYILGVGIASFLIAAAFYVLSQVIAQELNNIFVSALFLILVIFTGILFDTVGTAAAAATEETFHALASKRVSGATQGVYLVRNADKVANIANDFIGDIAGTVSGALGISLILQIINIYAGMDRFLITVAGTALISALTVGGKAIGKKTAISKANDIIFLVGRIIARTESIAGCNILPRRRTK